MYTLHFLKTKNWRAQSGSGGYLDGTLSQIAHFLITYWNITEKEINAALDEMVKNNHDSARFGISRVFLYSFDSKENKNKYGFH